MSRTRELVNKIVDAVMDAENVETVLTHGTGNEDFSEDSRNKLRVSARELQNLIDDLSKPRNTLRRLARDHADDQMAKLRELEEATREAKALFRGISIAARARESSSDSSSSQSSSSQSSSSGSSSGAAPSWGSRGHYSRFVPRSAARAASGRKRSRRKKTRRRKAMKRKHTRRASRRR